MMKKHKIKKDDRVEELIDIIRLAPSEIAINFYFTRPFNSYKDIEDNKQIQQAIKDRLEELGVKDKSVDTLSEEVKQSTEVNSNPFALVQAVRKGSIDNVVNDDGMKEKTTAEVYRDYLRFWSPALNEYELKFMNFLFEKILGYGKEATGDWIATEQMINGTKKTIIDPETNEEKTYRIDFGTGIAVGETYKKREAIHYRIANRLEILGLIKIRRGTKAKPKDKYPTNHYSFRIQKELRTWDDVKPITEKPGK